MRVRHVLHLKDQYNYMLFVSLSNKIQSHWQADCWLILHLVTFENVFLIIVEFKCTSIKECNLNLFYLIRCKVVHVGMYCQYSVSQSEKNQVLGNVFLCFCMWPYIHHTNLYCQTVLSKIYRFDFIDTFKRRKSQHDVNDISSQHLTLVSPPGWWLSGAGCVWMSFAPEWVSLK